MSLLNVLLQHDRAFVSVDTRCRDVASGDYSHSNKLLLMPQSNVIWAMRGERTFCYWLFSMFLQSVESPTFDLIERHILKTAHSMFPQYLANAREFGIVDVGPLERVEIVLVGYSDRTAGWAALRLSHDEGSAFETQRTPGLIAPAFDEDLSRLVVPDHRGYLLEVARAQVRKFRAEFPEAPIGGDLIVTELTQDRVVLETIRDFCPATA